MSHVFDETAPDAPCEFCGQPIDVGQAWMSADREGAQTRAHAECVYREEPNAAEHRDWRPGDPRH